MYSTVQYIIYVQYSTLLYLCKAVPNAAMFVVVFSVYVNYFIFDEKPFFAVIRNWINFRLRSFLYQGTLRQKIQAAVSYK